MQQSIYSYSLCASLALMLFFSGYFFFGRVPDRTIYKNYRYSRIIMGVALLTLSMNYCVHLFGQVRFADPLYAIFMNLSTYFLEAWLFSCALMILLVPGYLTFRRFAGHILRWVVFTAAGVSLIFFIFPKYRVEWVLVAAAYFLFYSFRLARRLFRTYKRAVRTIDDYHSDGVTIYMRWMSNFTYWAVVFGVGVGVLTFLPDDYIFLWILSAIPFYIYLFLSYLNYMLFYERVEHILSTEMPSEETVEEPSSEEVAQEVENMPVYYEQLDERIASWIQKKNFVHHDLTVNDVAEELFTNRTYLFNYIKYHYNVSFREWINDLRLAYAKQLLLENSTYTIADVAQKTGYGSLSHFTKLFSEAENQTPARWRKLQLAEGKE